VGLFKQKEATYKAELNKLTESLQQQTDCEWPLERSLLAWKLKELQLESAVNNFKMQNELLTQEKGSFESNLAELKKTNKELKEKLKTLNKDFMLLRATSSELEKDKVDLSKELERLRAEYAQRDSAVLNHEVTM
jgi:chromosome segregation ATPase